MTATQLSDPSFDTYALNAVNSRIKIVCFRKSLQLNKTNESVICKEKKTRRRISNTSVR